MQVGKGVRRVFYVEVPAFAGTTGVFAARFPPVGEHSLCRFSAVMDGYGSEAQFAVADFRQADLREERRQPVSL